MNRKYEVKDIIKQALEEDIRDGDVTSLWTLNKTDIISGTIRVKEDGVIAGLEVAKEVFKTLDKKITFKTLTPDGTFVKKGTDVAIVEGKALSILTAERTVLNFLQRMSGIATATHNLVEKVKGTKAVILDTRKTAPGLRILDKWAVKLGGGENHRIGLFDMVLIKDNHIAAAGGIIEAIEKVQSQNKKKLKVEVEVDTLAQLRMVLECQIDIIMLDNMNISEIKEAVKITNGKVKLEVSGGVTSENIREIAETGVDYISVGALTHSVKALDIGLEL